MKKVIRLAIFLSVIGACLGRREVNYLKLVMCPDYKNYTVLFHNIVFKRDKKGQSVSFKFNVNIKKEVRKILGLVSFRKCDRSGNLDSCEYYIRDFKASNICDLMGKQGQIWTLMVNNMDIPKSCPIPVGHYRLNETDIETQLQLSLMPIPSALWKMRFVGYDTGTGTNDLMVTCVDMDLEVYIVRKS